MDLGLASRNALVVGAAGGIGHAAAVALAAEGIGGIALGVRDTGKGDDVAAELTATTGVRTVVVGCDISDPASPDQAVADAKAALGNIDILVQAAGNPIRGGLHDVTDNDWHEAIESKFLGSMRLTRAVLPEMRERGWGRVILIAGLNGRRPAAGSVVGGVVNAALANLATALAQDVAADGVTVNVVDPHFTKTPRWDSMIANRMKQTGQDEAAVIADVLANVPSGRPVPPEHVGATIAFLVSDLGASVSGSALAVDSGSNTAIY